MTLNANLLFCRQCYAYCDQTAEARITRFHYEVPLDLSYARDYRACIWHNSGTNRITLSEK